jgi:integrase
MARAGLVEDAAGKPAKGRNKRTLKVVAFGPHTLRHVYASLQIESGVTPKKLQGRMGHSTLAMTMDYTATCGLIPWATKRRRTPLSA